MPTAQEPARSLRRGFSASLVGNMIYALSQWGMVVALAKLLTPADVGHFAYALALTGPVFVLAQLKLRSVVVTDAKRHTLPEDFVALRIQTTVLALVVTGVLAVALGLERQVIALVAVVSFVRCIDNLADIFQGFLQRAERMESVAVALSLNGLTSLILFWALLRATRSILAATAGSLIGSGVALLYSAREGGAEVRIVSAREIVRIAFRSRRTLSLAALALPAGISTALGSLIGNAPRYVIERELGSAPLGVYAALSYVMVAVTLIIPPLGQTVVPRLSRYYAAGQVGRFCRLLVKLVILGLAMGGTAVVCVALGGKSILSKIYGPDYAAHATTLLALTVVAGISAGFIFIGTALSSTRNFTHQAVVMAIAFVVLAAGLWVLVPRYGLNGAAYALAAAGVAEGLGNTYYLVRVLDLKSYVHRWRHQQGGRSGTKA